MDNLRLSIFREIASSVRSRKEYIHQIKLTYGEEAIPEALRVFDRERPESVPHQKRKTTEDELHQNVTLNLSWIAPSLGNHQVPAGQLILIIDAVLILASFLVPPFFVTLSNGATTSLGYHFISSPPTFEHVTMNPTSYEKLTGRIDVAVLLVEWICIVVISFLVWKFLVRKKAI